MNNLKKNVLISVANLEKGGQQRMAILLAEHLKLDSDYLVTFVVFTKDYSFGNYSEPQGVKFINIECPPQDGYVKKIYNILKRARIIKKIKEENNIDVSISFGATANIVNVLSRSKGRIVTSIRNSIIHIDGPSLIDKLTLALSDTVVFVSYGQRKAYELSFKKYSNKMKVIYNACDIKRIELESDVTEAEIEEMMFVSVGRLTGVKCFKNMINVFEIIVADYPEAVLYIIGDGKERADISKHIEEKGLGNNIVLLGNLDNPFSYIAKARVFLNASGSESFSNVVLEALACGTPVISTDCCFGPREILDGEKEYGLKEEFEVCRHGILVPPFDTNGNSQPKKERIFADAIRFYLENKEIEHEFRLNAKKRCETFSIDNYLDAWKEHINK